MYICIYTYIHTYIHTHTHAREHTHMHTHARAHTHTSAPSAFRAAAMTPASVDLRTGIQNSFVMITTYPHTHTHTHTHILPTCSARCCDDPR